MSLDWKAIGIATGVGISLAMQFGLRFLPLASDPAFYDWWRFIGPVIGVLADVVIGVVAAWHARQNSALHGALASLLASLVSVLVGTISVVAQAGVSWLLDPWYWLTTLFWIFLGVAVAAIAAAVSARILRQ
jgi:biotin transporter BioY